jgi:hypothetical protein
VSKAQTLLGPAWGDLIAEILGSGAKPAAVIEERVVERFVLALLEGDPRFTRNSMRHWELAKRAKENDRDRARREREAIAAAAEEQPVAGGEPFVGVPAVGGR